MLENFDSGGGIKKKRRNNAVFRPQSFHHTLGCILGSHNRLPLYIGQIAARSPSSVPIFIPQQKSTQCPLSSSAHRFGNSTLHRPKPQFQNTFKTINFGLFLHQNDQFQPIFVKKQRIFVDFAVVPLHTVPKTPCVATFTPLKGIFFRGFY
nr:MAG TPA: hypothetical protein [Caudoviricetes sp.]